MSLFYDYVYLCRLHRPIGIWLLFFPGLIGLSAAQKSWPLAYWIIFLVGAIVMRSAGCIYNDIIDRPFDGGVSRTKNRPMVRKRNPVSIKRAFLFLILNLIIGLVCLLQLNLMTIGIGVVTAFMIAAYPWMKRITYWPQLFLGFTMNMGFLIGWIAVDGSINIVMFLLYLGMVSWTLGYDTIYGFQDINDDALIGVKSSSLKVQHAPKRFLAYSYSATIVSWISAGILMNVSFVYYLGVFFIFVLFFWQIFTLNPKNPSNCLKRFQSNQWVGIVLWGAVILGI
jgi:4-hydroxybenzoate polyprenyltransferase